MAGARTFHIRYGLFRPLLSVLALGPAFSRAEVDDERLRVRMGWAFQADIPRASITAARPHTGFVGGIGVHGGRKRWLVNGGIRGIVDIDVDPPARGRVLGLPAKVRRLQLSVTEPDTLIAALRG